jgi:multiple sugar transport system permease protein
MELSLKSRERRVGFALTVPALLAFAVMILLPFVQSFRLAFYKFTVDMQAPVYVGLANFARILSDPGMATVWWNTLVFVVLTTGLTLLLGLAWALVVNQTFWGRSLLRSLSLLPWVLPTTVTAFLAAWIFNGQYGVLNAALLRLGVLEQPITWLAEPAGAMAAVILAKVWLSVPLFMAFFLAGLQTVSQDQLDAARVDGCSHWSLLRYVVLPHLLPTVVVVTVLGAMGNLQAFDVIYALTQGGPIKSTTMLSIEVYKQAFQNWDMGTASAVGVLWFFTIAVPAGLYLRILFRRED